ncbi:MAG: glycosyltransferase family 87 protein [Anaerolineales bacterium]
MKKTFPSLLILFGVIFTLFFLLADMIGLGKPDIQAAQIFGMEIGVLIVLTAITFNILQKKHEFFDGVFWVNLRHGLCNLPALAWVMLGALPAFILYFIIPMFFDPSHRIQYPVDYIRQIVPIGIDLQAMLNATETWLKTGQSTQYVYTPLINILFAPLLLLGYPNSYYFITFVTLTCYIMLSLLAILLSDVKNRSVVIFIAVVSIFSYGLMFELERGQTYTLSLALCVLAFYIFYRHPDFRLLAYLLFSISIQLKFYPALFVLLFVDDWRDWKNTLFRFTALGLVNFLLLFLFGFPYFSIFFDHMVNSVQYGEAAVVNHSIHSFVFMLSSSEWNLFNGATALWIEKNSGLIGNLLYGYVLICFSVVLVYSWKRNKPGFNADLFLTCVIGSLVLPSINHDYTLPLLMAPVAMSIAGWHAQDSSGSKIFTILLTIITSFAYAITLIPHVFKPIYLKNSLPLLIIILTAAALQNIVQKTR